MAQIVATRLKPFDFDTVVIDQQFITHDKRARFYIETCRAMGPLIRLPNRRFKLSLRTTRIDDGGIGSMKHSW